MASCQRCHQGDDVSDWTVDDQLCQPNRPDCPEHPEGLPAQAPRRPSDHPMVEVRAGTVQFEVNRP